MCGQLRDIDFCIESFKENIISKFKDCDIFISTQDVNSIKPRIDTSAIVNQYIFIPITYDINKKITHHLGNRLKFLNIRKMYKTYIENQSEDLLLKNFIGWMENFKDFNICLDAALEYEKKNNIKYDLFIKTRPDIIYCKPFDLSIDDIKVKTLYTYDKNDKFIWDAVFGMDYDCALELRKFYDFYSQYSEAYIKHLKDWKHEYNTEDFLYLFCKVNKINIIDIKTIGYPLSWLIGDLKNNLTPGTLSYPRRYLNLNKEWVKKISHYTNQCKTILFDIKLFN